MVNRTRWTSAGGHGVKNNRPVEFGKTALLRGYSAFGTPLEQTYDVRG